MNPRLPLFGALALMLVPLRAAETFDEAMARTAQDYRARIQQATEELNLTRARIAAERAPMLQQMRTAENRIITAQGEALRFDTAKENFAEDRRGLLKELDALRRNTAYVATLAHDSLKAFGDSLAPGEEPFVAGQLQALQQTLDDTTAGPNGRAALDAADFLLAQTRRELGGYAAAGSSMIDGTSQVVKGTFAFVGPETFFRADQGGAAGTVRSRPGASQPVTYLLPAWKPDEAAAFFDGRLGTMVADASGGKALRLKETTGTVWAHIQKGGAVAYAIVLVGLIALLMIAQKIGDLMQMGVDNPATVHRFLQTVTAGPPEAAVAAAGELKAMTRELFTVGLHHRHETKAVLEEQLQATLLRQQLHFERRLPLLAVIATAAPLMGLLGTVVGMVKTFALITVFGTGNAGKLASGISEVLVATELGLTVAIPTLIAHGFLAHRIQKNLSLLERYALQFVTAVSPAESAVDGRNAPRPLSV